jgi:hypothetical protein
MEGDQKTKQITKSSPPLRAAQGTWAQSDIEKANTFAEHLANMFQPHPSENSPVEKESIYPLPRNPLPTGPSPQPSPAITSSCRRQKSQSKKITWVRPYHGQNTSRTTGTRYSISYPDI